MDDPFVNIIITAKAHNVIRSAALTDRPFQETATRLPDGTYSVPLQVSTVDAIMRCMFLGESISDAIVRLLATRGKPLQ
jgi:hypothetical protein